MPLVNVFRFFPAAAGYGLEVLKQKKFQECFIMPHLKQMAGEDDGSLTEKDYKRMASYALLTTTTLGENMATLRGRALTEQERTLNSLLGTLTPLYDDFFDKPDLSEENVLAIMQNPEQQEGATARERLFIAILQKLKSGVPDQAVYNSAFADVYRSQKASIKQFETNLPKNELQKILYEKGGFAAVLFRTLYKAHLSKEERAAWMQWGYVIQLLDDTFDLWEDHDEGLQTLATQTTDMEQYASECHAAFRELASRWRNTPYSSVRIQRSLNKQFFIICWGLVALKQFIKLQKSTGKPFQAANFERKQLICDMDVFKNQVRGVRAYVDFSF